MLEYIFIPISSFILTFLFTPLARKIAFVANVFDNPSNDLKVHKKPIPYLGGIALVLGILIALVVANHQFSFIRTYFLGLLTASIIITSLGLLDDLFDIKQTYKFFVQIILAIGLVSIGFRVETFPAPYIAIPLTIFYITGGCNALNLLDGLDGLAAGISAISSLFFFVLFLDNNNIMGIAISLSLLGSCVAFLVFNFNPASIFMGDAGSMFLGMMLSVLMIHYSDTPFEYKFFLIPILICGVPIFDTALTYTRRYINKKPVFPGDRSHFYDQLIDRGFSVRKTVLISYCIGIFFGIVALIMYKVSDVKAALIFLSVLFTLIIVVRKMNMLKMNE